MTKKDKILALYSAMATSTRGGEKDSFYHFSDKAPKELVDLFLEHYDVRDIDYETFSRACDIVSEAYASEPDADYDAITDVIYEASSGSANVYTDVALGYLSMWNQDEISDIVRDTKCDIAQACMQWYDTQVEQQAVIIKDWVNA